MIARRQYSLTQPTALFLSDAGQDIRHKVGDLAALADRVSRHPKPLKLIPGADAFQDAPSEPIQCRHDDGHRLPLGPQAADLRKERLILWPVISLAAQHVLKLG